MKNSKQAIYRIGLFFSVLIPACLVYFSYYFYFQYDVTSLDKKYLKFNAQGAYELVESKPQSWVSLDEISYIGN